MNMEFQGIAEEGYAAKFFKDAKMRAKLSACQSAPRLKDESVAAGHRQQGNSSFRGGHYTAALHQYGQAVLTAASADMLSSALANRSAALYHLQRYQDSLQDMGSALEAGYPSDRHHKLHERRARCHLALGRPERAAAALGCYRTALQALSLAPANRDRLAAAADTLRAEIERAATDASEQLESAAPQPALEGGSGPLVSASRYLQLRQTERKGRHVVTSGAVRKGAVLFAEPPYVCVLLPDRQLDHCHHCLRHTYSLLPCGRCRDVGFCGAACREAAAAYHGAECGHAEFLEAFGIGRAAVRVVLTAGWRRLEQLRRQLPRVGGSCRPDRCSCHRPDGDRYLAVFHLAHHLERTQPEDAYHYGRAAATLAVFLAERTAFFGDGAVPEWSLLWTAALLLRHILQLVCNAHAPTTLVPLPGDGGVVQLSEQRVATAIYPSASYMNHSCDPSIINSFWGSTLIVRSIKSLSAGAEVFHCYGPHFARSPPAERRQQLLEQYHFLCDCRHCTQPELAHHLELLNSPLCLDCGGGTLPAEDDSRRRCQDCGHLHCYRQRLQRLRSIETEAETVTGGGRPALDRLDSLLQEARSLARPAHETLFTLHDLRARLCSQLGEPALALESLRPNLSGVEARYGADSVELGNLLLTATDLLLLARAAAHTEPERRELGRELREAAERGLAIFSIHYGEWSAAYCDLQRKLATVPPEIS